MTTATDVLNRGFGRIISHDRIRIMFSKPLTNKIIMKIRKLSYYIELDLSFLFCSEIKGSAYYVINSIFHL